MSETMPKLTVYRPVLNFDETTFDKFQKEVYQQGIGEEHIRMMGRVSHRAVILNTGDVQTLLEHFDMKANEHEVGELGDYIEAHMPESSDRQISIPTYPSAEHRPLGTQNVRLFTVGILSSIIREERRQARLLTEEFFGLDQEDTTATWPNWDYMGQVWVARPSAPYAVRAVRDVLKSRQDLLPETINLGPINIDSDV